MADIRRNWSFLLKTGLAVGLTAAADGLFYCGRLVLGWNLGLFALALLAAAVASQPALRKNRAALGFAGVALIFALLQIETVSLLAWILY